MCGGTCASAAQGNGQAKTPEPRQAPGTSGFSGGSSGVATQRIVDAAPLERRADAFKFCGDFLFQFRAGAGGQPRCESSTLVLRIRMAALHWKCRGFEQTARQNACHYGGWVDGLIGWLTTTYSTCTQVLTGTYPRRAKLSPDQKDPGFQIQLRKKRTAREPSATRRQASRIIKPPISGRNFLKSYQTRYCRGLRIIRQRTCCQEVWVSGAATSNFKELIGRVESKRREADDLIMMVPPPL